MKNSLFTTLFLISFLGLTASADNIEWTLITDSNLDGQVVNEVETEVIGQMYKRHFYFHGALDTPPSLTFATGSIETESNDVGGGGQTRIHFSSYDANETREYTGHYVGDERYQGVWYGTWGDKGDFILDFSIGTPTLPGQGVKVEPLQGSATASTAYNSNPAKGAIDGILGNNNSNVWISYVTDPNPWLSFETETTATVYYYRMSRSYCNAQAYLPGQWSMYGSNDNATWTLIDTVGPDQGETWPLGVCDTFGIDYVVDNPGSYKFYKFDFTASSLTTVTGVGVGEIELYQ